MAVLAIINLDGDPDTLLKMYDQMDEAAGDVPTTGLISHVAARTATGLTMTDIWESAELLEAYMADPRFESELQRAGFPEPRVEVYPVDRQSLTKDASSTAIGLGS